MSRCYGLAIIIMAFILSGCYSTHQTNTSNMNFVAGTPLEFSFDTYDKLTIRKNPTTQVSIKVSQWPDNEFLLWFPEYVPPFWVQWTEDPTMPVPAEHCLQKFTRTEQGGLLWKYEHDPACLIESELIPQGNALLLKVKVTNRSEKVAEQVNVQNCFHLSAAPDFACNDFSRIYIRTEGTWRPLSELNPNCGYILYYRNGFIESGQTDRWLKTWGEYVQSARADCPLIICVSKDGKRCIATASSDYQCLFHNTMPYLQCLHSQQRSVPAIEPGETAVFHQWLYFFDGGLNEFISLIESDICRDDF